MLKFQPLFSVFSIKLQQKYQRSRVELFHVFKMHFRSVLWHEKVQAQKGGNDRAAQTGGFVLENSDVINFEESHRENSNFLPN